MDFKSATTRLRRTFAYPSDTTTPSPRALSDLDSDSDGPALDEQEQEDLIRALAEQNATRNAHFRIFLLSLPALSAIPYFLVLFGSLASLVSKDRGGGEGGRGRGRGRGSIAADVWIALLALSSLASTAWTLWSLPPGVTGIRALDAWVGSSSSSSAATDDNDDGNPSSSSSSSSSTLPRGQNPGLGPMGANARRRRRASAGSHSFFWAPQHHRSPLEQYLPFLNFALCGLLILAGFLSSSSQRSATHQHWGHVGLANLPALIYVVVLVAKMLMGSIDPERELSALRYEYKGA
ncbi:hypothetical protein F4859DRAFT_502773 [Xylaria cf. heliscus]|nr:hypothetical protein F4859DRAFT_502773 [Xylaria cf. heliscus]